MQDSSSKAPGPRNAKGFVLRFISGKYQGGEFPISTDKQIIVGRSSDLDMVLVEDMVSRKHAKIAMQTDGIWIEDLGSTNGTFVNGEKIKKSKLKEGDRILIGTSILKLMSGEAGRAAPSQTEAKRELGERDASSRTQQGRTMSGSIEEIPLPDLLQLFGSSKKNGVLVVRTEHDVGKIYLRKGNIYYANINDLDDVPADKAVYRLLTWTTGYFDLEPPDDRTWPNEVDLGVQEVLMEGFRLMDEFNRVKEELPELSSTLVVTAPLTAQLRNLSPEELDIFQAIINSTTVESVMNKSSLADVQTAEILKKLIKEEYVHVE